MNNKSSTIKKINSQILLLLLISERSSNADYDVYFFLIKYTFLFSDNDKTQKYCTLKTTHFHIPQGNGEKGARYLDPKYSRWISTDPALGEYVPLAPVNDEAKKHNENLLGMGGLFNTVNLSLYHYAGNNPVKYVDPDGRITKTKEISKTERTLEWSEFAKLRDTKEKKLKTRDTIHSIAGWICTAIATLLSPATSGTKQAVAKGAGSLSTIDGLLSVMPDNLAKLTASLQEVSNEVADISQASGISPTVKVVEITTRIATNEDVKSIGGAALTIPKMQHTLTETTILEITINGQKWKKPIVVSEKQTCTYEWSLNYEDFSWVR